ncbi:hypothetical protein MTR67_019782 [Solanum verrucosum]|uniref:Uncharacterized protein n=1 Tax=Solanum verrucosum TaxID=315347 RepID=A0AAF0QM44_SOLVR|nr:hypothetical protein KY284_020887 [Solanum tuberosum]WMV26397.1 hypothetical protein MTR67_019782 [Solanum verrucosum]
MIVEFSTSSECCLKPDLCKIKNDYVSQGMVVCDVSGTDISAAAFDLIGITKDCLQKKNDKVKKTSIKFDALESKFPDSKCFTPGWRTGYSTKLTIIKLQYQQEVAGKNS